jgi:hypothetical protein
MFQVKHKIVIFILLIISIQTAIAALNTKFTYQGKIVENNTPVNGIFDIGVIIYDAETNGNEISSEFIPFVSIVDGLFSIDIDIGVIPMIQGYDIWIQLELNDNAPINSGLFTTIFPRQLLTNSPFALHAQTVAENSIGGLSIFDGSIGEEDLGSNLISTIKLKDGAVTEDKIADDSITSEKIVNHTITGTDVAVRTIGGINIEDGAIINTHIATGTITEVQLANDSVTKFEIETGAVESDEIKDGTIIAADINSSSVQRRVNGTCSSGSSIRSIAADGSVTCEADDVGNSGWGLSGNSGTNSSTDFVGTTDDQALIFKANNTLIGKFESSTHNISLGKPTNSINTDGNSHVISGGVDNVISSPGLISSNSTIGGGSNNSISSLMNSVSLITIAGGGDNQANKEGATISGGKNNQATGLLSTVIGGSTNKALGENSVVAGGNNNTAGGHYSFAAGKSAKVRDASLSGDTDGDEGTFIWSSNDTFFTSTGPKQFLIEADGGVGIGTNSPTSPMHIKGQGTSTGSITGSNEVVLTIEPKDVDDNVATVLNKLDPSQEAALIYAVNGQPQFDIRNVNGGALDFSSYSTGSASFMMRIQNKSTNRIDFDANLEPQTNNTIDFGSTLYRWKHIYAENMTTTNPLNVSSDLRLKEEIIGLNYGLAEVLELRPVSYYWKKGDTQQLHLGLIAQEVETIIPEVVNKSEDEKQMRSMRYGELIPVLIKATQEQQVIIDQQSKDIVRLETMVKKMLASSESFE